jgi:hypothetical protein
VKGQQHIDGLSIPAVDPRFIRADDREDLRTESIRVKGELDVRVERREDGKQLRIDDTVTITIHDADGRVIATEVAELEGGGVKRVKVDGMRWLEKTWTAKIKH